jgi:hypothetical protein
MKKIYRDFFTRARIKLGKVIKYEKYNLAGLPSPFRHKKFTTVPYPSLPFLTLHYHNLTPPPQYPMNIKTHQFYYLSKIKSHKQHTNR